MYRGHINTNTLKKVQSLRKFYANSIISLQSQPFTALLFRVQNDFSRFIRGYNFTYAIFGLEKLQKSELFFGGINYITSRNSIFSVIGFLFTKLSETTDTKDYFLTLQCYETYENEIFDLGKEIFPLKGEAVSFSLSDSLPKLSLTPFVLPHHKHISSQTTLPESTTAFSCLFIKYFP